MSTTSLDAVQALLALPDAQDRAPEIVAEVLRWAGVSADRAWINGALFGWNCGVCCDDHACWKAIRTRQKQVIKAMGEL